MWHIASTYFSAKVHQEPTVGRHCRWKQGETLIQERGDTLSVDGDCTVGTAGIRARRKGKQGRVVEGWSIHSCKQGLREDL